MSDHDSDNLFRSGRYEEAAKRLHAGVESEGENGRDLLLFLLDEGLALHAAGKYAESNQVFLKADKIAEIKDYTSLSTEGATLLTSDNIKDYKGEDFEKVLINTYLSMNYALMGDYEDAIVEARRVNRKLYLMVTDGQRKYKQNAFARYLSAVLYEADGNFNDAYIDYKSAYEIQPEIPGISRNLWRMAWLLHERDEMDRWDEEFKLTAGEHEAAKDLDPRRGKGEIIVIYENGIAPVKKANPQFTSVPKFYPRYNPVAEAKVTVDGHEFGDTRMLHDIEATAIENLDEKYGGLVAKKIAGVVAKEVVAHQIARQTNSPLAGLIAEIAFFASDQADVRSWNLLPHDLQILRIPVDEGTHKVTIAPVGAGMSLPERSVAVGKGKKAFVDFRYMP